MLDFATPAWTEELVRCAASSPEYLAAAEGWAGTVELVVTDLDRPAGRHVTLTGRGGTWSHVHVGTARPGPDPAFTLSAPTDVWRDVLQSRLPTMEAIVSGRLRVRGHLPDLLRWRGAIVALTEVARQLPTAYPDAAQARR